MKGRGAIKRNEKRLRRGYKERERERDRESRRQRDKARER